MITDDADVLDRISWLEPLIEGVGGLLGLVDQAIEESPDLDVAGLLDRVAQVMGLPGVLMTGLAAPAAVNPTTQVILRALATYACNVVHHQADCPIDHRALATYACTVVQHQADCAIDHRADDGDLPRERDR